MTPKQEYSISHILSQLAEDDAYQKESSSLSDLLQLIRVAEHFQPGVHSLSDQEFERTIQN